MSTFGKKTKVTAAIKSPSTQQKGNPGGEILKEQKQTKLKANEIKLFEFPKRQSISLINERQAMMCH